MSPDPTLKNGTFNSCRNSTAIYKNQRRCSFHGCSKSLPSRQARSHTEHKTPPFTSKRDSLNNLKTGKDLLSVISFNFKHSFIHSHPSICPTNTACWPDYRIRKRIGPLARSSSPGAQNPVNTFMGHDLILTQKTRQ